MAELKDIDLEIIRHLYNLKTNQTITTYSLAKKLFNGSKSENQFRFYNNKTKFIDYRMKKLDEAGVIDISQNNGKKIYTLILNNVYFKRIRYKKLGIDSESIFIKNKDEWAIYVL